MTEVVSYCLFFVPNIQYRARLIGDVKDNGKNLLNTFNAGMFHIIIMKSSRF